MANSEGRKGGMNFNKRQLQKEWKPKGGSTFEVLNQGLTEVEFDDNAELLKLAVAYLEVQDGTSRV